jgi:hypothetical protein
MADSIHLVNFIDLGTVEEDSLNDWLLDIDRSRYLVDLLRRCLIGHATKLGIGQDKKKRFYFRSDKGKTRSLATLGDRGRSVAAEKKNAALTSPFVKQQSQAQTHGVGSLRSSI